MEQIGFIGGGVVLVATLLLTVKYFPEEVGRFMRRLGAPSTSSIKKQSDEMLAEMDKKVAARKLKDSPERPVT